ncbi:alpha/beta fold hydrolase [Actinacidiphila bryophytorum]|uniref:Alpha/beta hydrolase n=1 Tax=Actinacidiphila bryophytorum TaxID=1436133 RepID=A0A9W4H610_9ACTN|nr:alpha/beta hydrolase [Actinacidiphila bryophytorum]MBM9439602.1 alpha/beta hydrolase [Actinacidiphila bryophytorum]MBN6543738.1 alpha/beta hydrolase [Actinacidiphila bryophytorum]CAG7653354.1 Alpha/beta hydrolase [Actinacidiphila bryophytorum]
MPALQLPRVAHRFVEVDGLRIFYREAGPDRADAPVLLLLHGFPSASHQYRRLIDALGGHYRVVAPDYPGFGHSELPADDGWTFDRLAGTVEGFCRVLGLDRFTLYAFDFGAPVGFRLATRHPEWIAGLVVQNGNAYEEGLSEMARGLVAENPEDETSRKRVGALLTLETTRGQYEGGTADPAAVAPEGWTLDQHFLDLPGRHGIQLDLLFDYRSNVALYPQWQEWLRQHRPPLLVVWGTGDAFFTEAGARAYARDVPGTELHLFDTGHFALEEKVGEIAPLIADFLDRTWQGTAAAAGR